MLAELQNRYALGHDEAISAAAEAIMSRHPADRDLLNMLLLGLTDAAVGAALRISVRTVQRRVADLMETAGVTTRVQLGAEAVRRSWV